MTRYPKQHYEIPQILMAVLATDTIGHLPITSKGNRWVVTTICLDTSYMITVLMKEKSAENIVQANLSGILAHKGESVAMAKSLKTRYYTK